jgi:hypothetical protein
MAIGSHGGIVRAIEPLLHEHELRLVVEASARRPGPRASLLPKTPRLEADSLG